MYALGVDLGTTFTAAAICRDGQAEIVTLGSRASVVPSVVVPREDGSTLTGEAASRRASTEPERVAREFKRRLGDPTPILLGGVPYSAPALTARLLRSVVDDVSGREGGLPSALCLSHPANWGPYKVELLRQVPEQAGVELPVSYTTEPEAAATCYAHQERVPAGAMVAVYDLGGGTFDAAVLRKTHTGFEIIGQPGGIERLGGIDFDAAVFAHVARALGGKLDELDEDDPAVIAAVGRLRAECTAAKEALSADTDASIAVLLPGITTEVRLTRAELEAMVRPALHDTIEILRGVLRTAQVSPGQLHSVLLVGGSSRMPVVAQLVGAELGRPVAVDTHPKHAVALGAAWLASGAGAPSAPAVPAAKAGSAAPIAPAPVAPVRVAPAAAAPPPVRDWSRTAQPTATAPAAAQPATTATVVTPGEPPPPPPRPPVQPARPGRRRRLVIGAVAAVVLLAAAGAGYALLRPDSDPPPPPFRGALAEQTNPLWGVAYSPDGTLVASAGLDQTVRLWDTVTGQQRGEPLTGHTNEVASVTFSPDGTILASTGDDQTIRLWSVATGLPQGEPLTEHTDEVTIARFSPDGRLLASAGDDRTVRLWDVATGAQTGVLIEGVRVRTVAFSPDGATLAVGGFEGQIWLADLASQAPGAPLTGHQGTVRSLAFSPDGTTLASGADDGTVRLWDVAGRQPRGEPLTGHTDQVWGVAFSPDGGILASGGMDRTVRLWDVPGGQPRGEPLTGHTGPVRGVAVSPDGRSVASASDDRTIRIWDLGAG